MISTILLVVRVFAAQGIVWLFGDGRGLGIDLVCVIVAEALRVTDGRAIRRPVPNEDHGVHTWETSIHMLDISRELANGLEDWSLEALGVSCPWISGHRFL